jgi:subtilisin family serine protease
VHRRLVLSGLSLAIALGLAAPVAHAGVLAVGGSVPREPSPIVSGVPYEPDVVLVRFKPWVDESEQEEAVEAVDGEIAEEDVAPTEEIVPGLEEVELPSDVTVVDAVETLEESPDVLYAEPSYAVQLSGTPNDSLFSSLWGMTSIRAPLAWGVSTGSSQVVVAIIDTGIDYTHPDLAANMWTNPGETAGNGLDDDGNGCIDDLRGCDFANDDGDPMDDNNHGTHVAGTIGAVGNNGVGVAGINWSVRLMALKFLKANGSGWTSDAIDALNYAVAMGAKISSNSWGGGGYSQALSDAIAAAGATGHLFVAAAGNTGSNNDGAPFYPASYNLASIISVAALDSAGQLAAFSNYGAASVDLGAPGVGILSTVPGSSYASYSGTSMATPHVAGAAALLLALHPGWTQAELKAGLLSTTRSLASLSGKSLTGGSLDLAAAAGVPTSFGLTVTVQGSGAVTSTPSGIQCGATCSASFATGSVVTLRATATGRMRFTGWSGACSGTALTCQVTMNETRSVTATFATGSGKGTPAPSAPGGGGGGGGSASYRLNVAKQGNGAGIVTSSPAGIQCGSSCSADFSRNMTVTLTASAFGGARFVRWSGACSGATPRCTLTMSQARTVIATFNRR